MPGFSDEFLGVPERPEKPRETGLTHVMDKGLNLRDIEGLFDTAGAFVDIVKLGWGTSYVTNNLEKKISLYRHFETPVVCGGTFFEAVYARDKIEEFKSWLTKYRFSHVEISDGTIEIPRDRKLELIADFSRDFTVLSEVGSKDSDVNIAPYLWARWMQEELDAGAWRVIAEGREGGTAGIYRPSGELRTGLVDEIEHSVSFDSLIWEAPSKESQAWFIKHFGTNVNLGNIPPEEVIALETLRLGLRGDTLKEVLRVASLQVPADVETWTAQRVVEYVLDEFPGRVALACSFQKEESVLLDMLFEHQPQARVFAIDTHHLFPETYELWREVERRYGTKIEVFAGAPVEDGLWDTNPDLYLSVAKIEPLNRALLDLDCWITGIRRDQSPVRADAPKLGWDSGHELWKADPLADWTEDDCWAYVRERGLPYNALHDRGYESIGDTHSTQPGKGREGRWAGTERTECGLHT